MRIGIVINIDTETLLPYLNSEEEKKIIQRYCSPNGAPAVNTLINSFLQFGNFVRVFTIAEKSFTIITPQVEIYATTPYNGYPIKYLWGEFKTAHRLREMMRNHLSDLDVLHAHWTYQYAYAAVHFETQLPVFCTVRDISSYIWRIESLKNKVTWTFKRLMNNLVFKHPHVHFIANSPYTAEVIKKKYNKEVPVIPNSIKDSFICKKGHHNPNNFKILCVSSSNDKRKNISTLLQAFQLFKKKYPDSELQLIGAPFVSGDKIIEKWRDKHLLESVELIGKVAHNELITYYDNCSVFITPSLEETFGNTILESIVRKVPVIGGEKSGAVPYVLHHGRAGYLCDVTNPKSIFQILEYVFHHPREVSRKVQDAYDIILSEYSEIMVANKHLQLYNKYIMK